MAHYANVAAPSLRERTTEGFHDSGIANTTCRPKAQAMEDHIHAIRVTGIDKRSFAVCCTAADLRGKRQLQRQSNPKSSRRYQFCPSILALGNLPRGLERGSVKDDSWPESTKCSRKRHGLEFPNLNRQESSRSAKGRSTRVGDQRHLAHFSD